MNQRRFIALAIAAVLAICSALYLSARRNVPRETAGGALLPYLAKEMNTVTALSVRKGSATPSVTLHSQGGRWTVAERGDYPADVSKLRKLLLALSDARIIEEKTSNPASFPAIGVEDPAPGAAGAEISFTAQDGRHAVIVGKPMGEGNFARRGGENTSYIVEPAISFEAEPRYWIDSRLIDIAAGSIQSMQVKPAEGPAYTVHRASAAADTAAANTGTFVLDGVPAGRQAADSALLAPSPTTYSGLAAEDVAPAESVDFSKPAVATLTLSDGNVVTITGATGGDKHWIQLHSSKDMDLDAKAAGRAFEIAGYRYDAIFRPLEQLLVPKPSQHPPVQKKSLPVPSS
jgi:hypothetical protein